MDVGVQFCFFNGLKNAVMSKDPRKVEEILKVLEKEGIPIAQLVSMQNEGSNVLLHFAVQMGNPDILRQLLVHSDEESVNKFTTPDHLTLIMLLLRSNHDLALTEEMLLGLLAAKADPNLLHSSVRHTCWGSHTHSFCLPLFCALQKRQWRLAEILLDAGADPCKRECSCHPIGLCWEKPHLVQRLLNLGCYCPNLLGQVLRADYEGRSEESMLNLCKMILPYHSGPEMNCGVILEAAETGFFEVLLYLLSELKPGLREEFIHYLPKTLMDVSKNITLQNYRRFLSAYFRFLDVNQFKGSAYLYLLLTAWNFEAHLDNDFMLSFDLLSTAAHYISSPRAFAGILPTLLELGLKSSSVALASFAVREEPDEYGFHLANPEYRDVLTRLSSNCCEEIGTCWFRQPFFLAFCYDALDSNYQALDSIYNKSRRTVLLTLLRLGVNIGDVLRPEPFIENFELSEDRVEIIKHFEPRPMTSWLPQSPRASAIIAKYDGREPASLMQLSRQALRSGLGFCRIEEKIKSFKHKIPRVIHDYICFQDDATLAYFEKNRVDPTEDAW